MFIAAQVGGAIAGVAVIKLLYPALTPAQAASIVVPRAVPDDTAVLDQDRPVSR